jgi:hypothetical protein
MGWMEERDGGREGKIGRGINCGWGTEVYGWGAKKIYRLKEDQAFRLSLELGRREKFARHTSADFLLSPTCPPICL